MRFNRCGYAPEVTARLGPPDPARARSLVVMHAGSSPRRVAGEVAYADDEAGVVGFVERLAKGPPRLDPSGKYVLTREERIPIRIVDLEA